MILEKIENCQRYDALGPLFQKGFEFLRREDLETLPVGKYPIVGTDCYAIVKDYTTRDVDQCELETHIEYIDIHYVFDGFEYIAYADKSRLTPASHIGEFGKTLTDVDLYEKEYNNKIFMEKGDVAIFFLNDGHMPHRKALVNSRVRKVIIKIRAAANEALLNH